MFEAKEIIPQNTDWIALVFFSILAILTFLKVRFKDRLYHTSMLLFSKKYVSVYFNKEKTNVLNVFQILFFLIQLLIISLFFYITYSFFQPSFQFLTLKNYLIILGGVFLYFSFRFILGSFLATIFNLKIIFKKILFEKINYLNSLILWIITPLLFLTYARNSQELFLWITVILFVGLLILRYSLILKNNKSVLYKNLFYFILYLCALEIAPLVIILKLTI